jgi:hypothetical protein
MVYRLKPKSDRPLTRLLEVMPTGGRLLEATALRLVHGASARVAARIVTNVVRGQWPS